MERPRAADDFEVIRERLEQLRREREEIAGNNANGGGASGEGAVESDAERRRKDRIEGAPPAWVPTIFLPQPTD
jgi:hypothetical protein